MKTENKNSLNNFAPIILFILSILFGALCLLFGEVALPLPIACLAALYCIDESNNRLLSIIASSIIILFNLAGLLLGISFSTFGLSIVVLAFLMSYGYTKEQTKSDIAFLMTIFAGLFCIGSYALFAMRIENSYTLEAVVDFSRQLTEMLRESFVSFTIESYTLAGIAVDAETIRSLFNSQLRMIISYVFIIGFAIAGISLKLFSFVMARFLKDEKIKNWRFFTSNLYAYSYAILTFAILFLNSLDSALSVAIFNLYNIFMVIYAYVGFNLALARIHRRFNIVLSIAILAFSITIFSSLAFQILAVIGVLFTIRKNKEDKLSSL